ncbi:hypothetical protein ACLI1C_16060 [Devosia sp. XGJD_8]|uniref:hypothetical protein n=1 Tax=Devosia sp. XGJD_8 TaxID=3391187 RepID=UPI0039854FC3
MANTVNRLYPLPDETKNVRQEIENLQQQVLPMLDNDIHALFLAIADLAPAVHGHGIDEITGLTEALAGKMPAGTTFSLADLTDTDGVDEAPDGYVMVKSGVLWVAQAALAALGPHGHTIEQVSGLGAALDAKAALSVVIRHDTPQGLAAAAQGRARANIGFVTGDRSPIINGDFGNWQRATSVVISAGSNNFAGDRWRILNGTDQPLTALLYTMLTADLVNFPSGVRSALRINFAVAPTSGAVEIQQRIERVDTFAGKKATATGYVYLGGSGTTFQHYLTQVFGSGGSANADQAGAPLVPAASTWAKVQTVLDVPSVSGKTFGSSGEYLAFRQFIEPRAAANYYLTHVSLVEGDATAEVDPFPARNAQQELALCQRYYEKGVGASVYNPTTISTTMSVYTFFMVTKRVTPTCTIASGAIDRTTTTGIRSYQNGVAAGTSYDSATYTADAEI